MTTEDDKILLRRIAAMPYEAEYDVGVVNRHLPKLIQVSHEGVLHADLNRLRHEGLLAFTTRTERFAQSPRHVEVFTVTALGRHAAGLVPPPRVRKHRPETVKEEA